MLYSRRHIAKLRIWRKEIEGESSGVQLKLASRAYKTTLAAEYANHGAGRRILILLRCVDRVFSIIPPGATKRPAQSRIDDVIINLQAFTFNIFGFLDNLAWVWVLERGVTDKKTGLPLEPMQIGLGRKYGQVWKSLPATLRTELRGFRSWFDYLESFRHGLAHRVPLYIPPYFVATADEVQFQRRAQAVEAAYATGAYDAFVEATADLHALGKFEPVMLHSIDAPKVFYHGQVLTDLRTVAHIANRLLAELDRP